MGCVQSYFKRAHNAGLSPSSTQDSNSKAGGDGEIQEGNDSEKEKKTSVSQEKLPEEPQSNDTSYGVEATAVRTLAASTGTVAILGTTAKTGETSLSQTDLAEDTKDINLSIQDSNNEENRSNKNSNKNEDLKQSESVNKESIVSGNTSPSNTSNSKTKDEKIRSKEDSDVKENSIPIENQVKAEVSTTVENSIDSHSDNVTDQKAISSEPVKQTTTALVESIKDESESSLLLVNGEINNKDDVFSSEDNIEDDEERPPTVVEIEKLNNSGNECKSPSSVSENSGSDDTKGINDDISSEQLKTNSLSDTTLSESFNAELDSVKHSPDAIKETFLTEKSKETVASFDTIEEQNNDAIVIENPLFLKNEINENLGKNKSETPPAIEKDENKTGNLSVTLNKEESIEPQKPVDDSRSESTTSDSNQKEKAFKEQISKSNTPENKDENKPKLEKDSNQRPVSERKSVSDDIKPVAPEDKAKHDLNKTEITAPEKEEDEERLAAAATTIQATFRGFQTRQNIQTKEKEGAHDIIDDVKKENKTPKEKPESKEEPITENKEKEKLESAATTIQATFRGYQTRQNIQKNEVDDIEGKDESKSSKGEIITSEDDTEKLESAATTIQATFRGYQTRQNIQKKETDKPDDKNEPESAKEETIIPEKDTEKLESAATTIQATFRGYQTRQNIQKKESDNPDEKKEIDSAKGTISAGEDKEKLENAATTIQATFRGYQARQNIEKDGSTSKGSFDSVKEEINPIMSISIKEKSEKTDGFPKLDEKPNSGENLHENTETNKDLVKSEIDGDKDSFEDEKLESAATTIQSNFRGYKVRKNLDKKNDLPEKEESNQISGEDGKLVSAATTIQASFRGFQTRQKLKDGKQSDNEDELTEPPIALTPEVIESVKEEVNEICKQAEETTENMIKNGTDMLFRAKLGSASKTENEEELDIEIQSSENESITETANKTVQSIVEEAEQIADQKMNSAATRIQASFRGFQVRKNLEKTEEPDSIPDFPPSTDEDYLFGTPVLDDDLPPPDFEALESSYSEEVATEPLDIPMPLENLPIPESEEVSEASTEVNDDDLRHLQKPQECDELKKTQDLETSSEGESSLSSAATKIQAGIRGYLTRKHKHNVQGGTGTTSTSGPSIASSDQSLGDLGSSKDEEGPVRSMISTEEETEIVRHQSTPEKKEPKSSTLESKLSKKRMSLDSRLVVYPPSKNARPLRAMSVSSPRDDITNEEVWQTLQHELTSAATRIQSNYRGYRARKQLTRGDAVQMATTSSSTTATTTPNPGSLDGSTSHTGPVPERTSGEYHDIIVLTPPNIATVGEEKEEDLEEEEKNDKKGREGRVKPAGEMTAPATSEDESRMVKRQHTDTSDDKDNSDGEGKAAAKIQAHYRGYKVRKTLKTEGDESLDSKGVITTAPLNMKNQPNESQEPKEQSARNSADVENEAAKKIQAGFRGMKTRQELKQKQQNSSK